MKNKLKLLLPAGLLLFLSGCVSVVDKSGKVIQEKVIHLSDPWKIEGLFDSFLIWPLSQIVNYISSVTGPTVAIVVVTVIVKLATLPLTVKQQIQSQKMQELQPKVQAIQEKYKGRNDSQAQMMAGQEMQALYQKHDIKMSGMFLPLLIQLPIILCLYQAVQRAESVVNGSLFGHSLETTPLNGILSGQYFYLLIFVVLLVSQGASMLLPQWLSKRKQKLYPGQKPAKQNNTTMYIFVAIFSYFGLVWNTGMAIYFIISSLCQIASTFYAQHIVDQQRGKA